jgi:hypothetical protein
VDPTLVFVLEPGSIPVEGCYQVGEMITVRLDMGFAPKEIVTGQFFLEYDPSTMLFVQIAPGATVDPSSPFSQPLGNPLVDILAGTIGYAVGVPPLGSGTAEPATMAVVTFQAVAECEGFVRLDYPHEPETALITLDAHKYEAGSELLIEDIPPITTDDSPPVMTACPDDIVVNPDLGELTAVLTWDTPTATDSCEGSVPVVCTPPSGWEFAPGTTTVTCEALNFCQSEVQCTFDVTVEPNMLVMDLELKPVMSAGPIVRCLTFEVFDCTTGLQRTVSHDVTFSNGVALGVNVPIHTGSWECATARDELHTLRSTVAPLTTPDDILYAALFTGNPDLGGHWLVGGNLNGDQWIDGLDYVLFLLQYLQPLDPDTTCGTTGVHADINGDGIVNVADLSHIQLSMLEHSEPNCCGAGGAPAQGPVDEISVQDLSSLGLGYLRFGDTNKNGKLDRADIAKFIEVHGPMGHRLPQGALDKSKGRPKGHR